MGKRKLRRAAPPSEEVAESRDGLSVAKLGGIGKASAVSRGKRKRSEKRAQVEAKNEFINAELKRLEADAAARREAIAANKRGAECGPALALMGAIGEGLEATETPPASGRGDKSIDPPAQKIVHERQRRRILAQETLQVRNVVEHPSFQANPMEALRQHLMNCVGEDPLAVPAPLSAGNNGKKRKPAVDPKSRTVRPTVSSRKTASSGEGSAKRREEKMEMAAKARVNRAGISKRSSAPRGRIGEKRPKI